MPQPVFHAVAIGWRTVRNFVDQEGVQWSGAIAFYLVLSVPPLLIAAFSVGVVLVGEETARGYLTNQVTQFLPAEQDLVERIVGETIQARGPAAAISLGFLLFSGSRVFASLIASINVMWEELPQPGFWRRQITRIVMVLTIGGIFALAALADLIIAFAGDLQALPAGIRTLLQSQLVPSLFLAALFLLFLIVPRQLPSALTAFVGALVGMIALRVAQAGFTAYLATFGGFDSAYGPIAGRRAADLGARRLRDRPARRAPRGRAEQRRPPAQSPRRVAPSRAGRAAGARRLGAGLWGLRGLGYNRRRTRAPGARLVGEWPSGKAPDSGSGDRRFESFLPSHPRPWYHRCGLTSHLG